MLEIYLFIFALVATTALVLRRLFISKKKDKAEFKQQVSEKVEENKREEQ